MTVTIKLIKYTFGARKQLFIYFDEACCSRTRISARFDKIYFFSENINILLFPNTISSLKKLSSFTDKG